MNNVETIDAIYTRRSVRTFERRDVEDKTIRKILDAGRWAPSGLNNQPWRFIVVKDDGTKEELSKLTTYGNTIQGAPVLIAVFMDTEESYDRTKDTMAIGACNQNMLLAVSSMGLGGVWLGEILKNKAGVSELLESPERYELMAILAIGYPIRKDRSSKRKDLEEMVHFEKYGG